MQRKENNNESLIEYLKLLPLEILVLIILNIKPSDFLALSETNKFFSTLPSNQIFEFYWKRNLAIYFPILLAFESNITISSWLHVFKSACESLHNWVPQRKKKLFLSAKKHDSVQFLENFSDFNDLYLTNSNGKPLYEYIIECENSCIIHRASNEVWNFFSTNNNIPDYRIIDSKNRNLAHWSIILNWPIQHQQQYNFSKIHFFSVDIYKKDQDGLTPLHLAAQYGRIELLKKLLDCGAYIDEPDLWGATPLILAVIYNQKEIVEILLDRNAKITDACLKENETKYDKLKIEYKNLNLLPGNTAVDVAVKLGRTYISSLLISKLKFEQSFPIQINTLFLCAVTSHHVNTAMLDLFLDNGADVNYTFPNNESALNLAINKHRDKNIIEWLLKNGADTTKLFNKQTSLQLAININNIPAFNLLLKYQADIHQLNERKQTALHYAAQKGNVNAIKQLITQGANVNAQDINGVTPLFEAVMNSHIEAVVMLLGEKADVSLGLCKDHALPCSSRHCESGFTVLHAAVFNDDIKMVKILLHHNKTLLNLKVGDEQKTALHIAVQNRNIEIVKLLLESGADPNLLDKHGGSTLLYALASESRYKHEILQLLLKYGAKTEIPFKPSPNFERFDIINGETPLQFAARKGDGVAVRQLILAFADTQVKDSRGFSLSLIASHYLDIKLYLIKWLDDYMDLRSTKAEYIKSFSILGHTFFNHSFTVLDHKFNISKTDKLHAALALKRYLCGEKIDMDVHVAALSNGELGKIFKLICKAEPLLELSLAKRNRLEP